ncbi:hypothetical protein BGZ94_009419 [Podila epigama]|nr:hypothetical protein BGZ94_009419 [Podila epigama]
MTCSCPPSAYEPVCCVYTPNNNPEARPLLGHHQHHHDNTGNKYNQNSFYQNEKLGQSIPLPVQDGHHACQHQKSNRIKMFKRAGILLLAWFFFAYVAPMSFFHSHFQHSHGSGDLTYSTDICKANEITWDGPSTFQTSANAFRLHIGKGNMYSTVSVQTSDEVKMPTLKIVAKVSPDSDDKGTIHHTKYEPAFASEVKIDYLHLNIEIKENDSVFDAKIWYEDHKTLDPSGHEYRACARLEATILFPTSFTHYGELTIDGSVVDIHTTSSLDNLRFDQVGFDVSVGKVFGSGTLRVDHFDTKVNTGSVKFASIEVAHPGNALDIKSAISTGHSTISVVADPYTKDSAPHSVDISAQTGGIDFRLEPSRAKNNNNNNEKPADLNIVTKTKTGAIEDIIRLASRDQLLHLTATSYTGHVNAKLTDEFVGHFHLATSIGHTVIASSSPNSEGSIQYEKQTTAIKEGTRTFGHPDQEVKGLVDLTTKTGPVSLSF